MTTLIEQRTGTQTLNNVKVILCSLLGTLSHTLTSFKSCVHVDIFVIIDYNMTNVLNRLEFLPNEILIQIFQYFDIRDLFQAFYNLNHRFKVVLQSLNCLSLTLIKYDSNEINDYDTFTTYVRALTIDYAVNIDLSRFVNFHRLTLLSPAPNQLKQVISNALSYLEHLSIGYEHLLFSYYMPELCQKIFSNGFPCLKSCSLFEPRIIEIIPHLTQTTQLCVLKMDNIELLTYKTLLSLCPHLYLFQFRILNQYEEVYPVQLHLNLKQIIIEFQSLVNYFSDSILNQYLLCVPNLEKLHVHEINFDFNMKEYLNYDWLASSINQQLLLLRDFKYYFHTYGLKDSNEDILNLIKMNFKSIHSDRYQSRLIIN